jgi:hypothetical protein
MPKAKIGRYKMTRMTSLGLIEFHIVQVVGELIELSGTRDSILIATEEGMQEYRGPAN